MVSCPHVGNCPLFPLFTLRTALKVWQDNYCHSDYERCARYQRAMAGHHTPLNLLPNGTTLTITTLAPTSKP